MGAGRSGSWPLTAVAGVFELEVAEPWLGEDEVFTGSVIVGMVCVCVCVCLFVVGCGEERFFCP